MTPSLLLHADLDILALDNCVCVASNSRIYSIGSLASQPDRSLLGKGLLVSDSSKCSVGFTAIGQYDFFTHAQPAQIQW
jgi:hypothetical protein